MRLIAIAGLLLAIAILVLEQRGASLEPRPGA